MYKFFINRENSSPKIHEFFTMPRKKIIPKSVEMINSILSISWHIMIPSHKNTKLMRYLLQKNVLHTENETLYYSWLNAHITIHSDQSHHYLFTCLFKIVHIFSRILSSIMELQVYIFFCDMWTLNTSSKPAKYSLLNYIQI